VSDSGNLIFLLWHGEVLLIQDIYSQLATSLHHCCICSDICSNQASQLVESMFEADPMLLTYYQLLFNS